jgi:hypothetical protein
MENEDEPVTVMARTIYCELQRTSGNEGWLDWDALDDKERRRYEVAAARAHTAYHDQYDYMMGRANRR